MSPRNKKKRKQQGRSPQEGRALLVGLASTLLGAAVTAVTRKIAGSRRRRRKKK
ncbi:hypothetical protein [Brevibacterium luteolum]|uniref:hypothetical protein n=1 Tax=Brevibacterium luteolum TaxID=199591 RepID=UPI0015E14D9E|nr:hypothetical protein [Brevibacterium luteolum]MCT1873636.1 hypothetical protein [Brevibacterium luteolum]MCT1890934.1 hypothetical protein [Brevibacterium luteolum]MCT1893402.1 hypothetical protein [Brevibacterium luteolum]MCT1921607.1 hypothetical protein [Brevibacterium luteolum]MCT1924210.1 hypothetical protein [Brevibacterium luteolum]